MYLTVSALELARSGTNMLTATHSDSKEQKQQRVGVI
jgi:hypothetical protein